MVIWNPNITNELPENTWTHIIVTWDSEGKRIYINGLERKD